MANNFCDICETVLTDENYCPQCRRYQEVSKPMVKKKYSLEADHAELKKDIKKWMLEIDDMIYRLYKTKSLKAHEIADELDELTGEMLAVNI